MTYDLQELSKKNNIYTCMNFRSVLWTQGQFMSIAKHFQMKRSSRKALISLSLEALGLGNAVIYAEPMGERGIPCSWWFHGRNPWNTMAFPLVGRWSLATLLFIETLRCHTAKGKIQRVSLKNLNSNQQAGSATSRHEEFQVSGDLWVLAEIMGKFATYQSGDKDSCFSILFPVGVSFSKVNLT